ncbi:hypothetical protein DFH09DRAFT_1419421 [Mycena vulgaris]|nr:hypothetical protein DFH09DRAFT_1419421 [Mycena vulgaris]
MQRRARHDDVGGTEDAFLWFVCACRRFRPIGRLTATVAALSHNSSLLYQPARLPATCKTRLISAPSPGASRRAPASLRIVFNPPPGAPIACTNNGVSPQPVLIETDHPVPTTHSYIAPGPSRMCPVDTNAHPVFVQTAAPSAAQSHAQPFHHKPCANLARTQLTRRANTSAPALCALHPPKSSLRSPGYGRIPYSPRAPLVSAYTHPCPPPRMPPPSNENAQARMHSERGARAIAMESPSPRRLHPPPFATAPAAPSPPRHSPLAASLAGEPPRTHCTRVPRRRAREYHVTPVLIQAQSVFSPLCAILGVICT